MRQGAHRPLPYNPRVAYCLACEDYCRGYETPERWCSCCEITHLREVVRAWREALRETDRHGEGCRYPLGLQCRAQARMDGLPLGPAPDPCDCGVGPGT